MNADLRKAWKGPCCYTKGPKGDNTNTPIRQAHCLESQTITNSPGSNVTVRSKPVQTFTSDQTSKESPVDMIDSLPVWYSELEEKLSSKLASMIKTSLASEMSKLRNDNEEILKSLGFLNDKYDDIQRNMTSYCEDIVNLKKENTDLKNTISNLSSRLALLEHHTRETNIEIAGIPEYKSENLVQTVIQIGTVVACPIKEEDIFTCKRVAKLDVSSTRPRSVIVKLRTTLQRDKILAAVAKFNKSNSNNKLNCTHLGIAGNKNAPIYISEHLSPTEKALHAAVRIEARKKGYKYIWVRNGRVYVRKNDEAPSIFIKAQNDISKIQ